MHRKIYPIGFGILTLVLLAIGFWVGKQLYEQKQALVAEQQAQTLLERIETVAKLITVEGYFSEVYSYNDYWKYDWPGFQKKALLRVKAKVSVGYDLTKMTITVETDRKRLLVSQLPDPEILSIDHDIDYYDISEGVFNSFSEADYSRMSSNAKKIIREQALKSDLMLNAAAQGTDMLDIIRDMVESAGWRMEFVAESDKVKG
jgi:hypothetical protein